MKNIMRFTFFLLAASIVVFSTGCGDDNPGLPGGVTLGPEVSLNSGTGLVSFNEDRSLATPSFAVSISGRAGDAELRSLTIQQDGLTMSAGELDYVDFNPDNNPQVITGADVQSFNYQVTITPAQPVVGSTTFSFLLADADGETNETTLVINYISNPPLVNLESVDGFVSQDGVISTFSESFDVRLTIDDTENPLQTLTVLDGGTVIDPSRLSFNNDAFTAANPLTLTTGETDGTTFDIEIRPENIMVGMRTFTFQVADNQGIIGETSITLDYQEIGTPLSFDTTGVLFNASGENNGGLDLDNGTAVSFNSAAAEIQDEGINLDVVPSNNWRRQISSVNDAELRTVDTETLGDGFDFDNVVTQEEIASIFEGGGIPAGPDEFPNTDGDETGPEDVTDPVEVGDIFAVRRADRSYLIRIDEVNVTMTDNNDNYTISIKY